MARCDSYAFGNCTQGACLDNPWIPDGLHDGGDWAFNAIGFGLSVTMVPTVGAVVSYCRGHGYSDFGHVGTVLQVAADGRFLVREMNFVAFDAYDDRWSTAYDVCGFILPPGAQPGRGANAPGPVGAGPSGLVPWAPIAAFENVRAWTKDLGAELYGRALQVSNLADQLPG
jgi:surface antigen